MKGLPNGKEDNRKSTIKITSRELTRNKLTNA